MKSDEGISFFLKKSQYGQGKKAPFPDCRGFFVRLFSTARQIKTAASEAIRKRLFLQSRCPILFYCCAQFAAGLELGDFLGTNFDGLAGLRIAALTSLPFGH